MNDDKFDTILGKIMVVALVVVLIFMMVKVKKLQNEISLDEEIIRIKGEIIEKQNDSIYYQEQIIKIYERRQETHPYPIEECFIYPHSEIIEIDCNTWEVKDRLTFSGQHKDTYGFVKGGKLGVVKHDAILGSDEK